MIRHVTWWKSLQMNNIIFLYLGTQLLFQRIIYLSFIGKNLHPVSPPVRRAYIAYYYYYFLFPKKGKPFLFVSCID